jgi:hypothetical protein
MSGIGVSREKINARETVLSSDFNRMQSLASRDLQNLLADASADVGGTPITGLSGPCSLVGIAATFNMTLAAAQALAWNPGDSSLTVDDSSYEIARWAQTVPTFGGPSGNPRIDLVVVTPAAVDTDLQSRNILIDPTARTISPQNVFKTTNPQGTIAVIAGTPASSPVPPAVPAGAFALFEVFVPTGASDSTAFSVIPRMFRRAPFPWSTISGIVSGFHPIWDMTIVPGAVDSTLSFAALDDCRVIIDGELIETLGAMLEIFQDGAANPFGSAASATWHKPYYLYAVGGRHAPQRGTVFSAPVIIVESTTPPFLTTGRPTAAITTPRGSAPSSACVYIGMGAVCGGTTKRLPCIQDETFLNLTGTSILGINVLTHVATTANYEAYDVHAPPVVPLVSDAVKVFLYPGSTPTPNVSVVPDRGDGTAPAPGYGGSALVSPVSTLTAAGPILISTYGVVPMPTPSAPKFWVASAAGAGTTSMVITGYNHKVGRLRY